MVFELGSQNVIFPAVPDWVRSGCKHIRLKHFGCSIVRFGSRVLFRVQHQRVLEPKGSVSAFFHRSLYRHIFRGLFGR